MTSPSASSADASVETRSASPTVEPADGKSAVAEEISAGSGQDEQTQGDLYEQQGPASADESRKPKGRLRQKESRLISKRKRAYLDLFTKTAEGVESGTPFGRENAFPLAASRIGASWWEVEEKERFFSALACHGHDDLLALARYIGTKSELEVRLYVLALEAGLENDRESGHRGQRQFTRADAPAAWEVDQACEQIVDAAADALAIETRHQDVDSAKSRFGDNWVIDSDVAEAIEIQIGGVLDYKNDGDARDQTRQDEIALAPPLLFFDTSVLLQLSCNVFMNGPPDGDWNYRTADLLECGRRERLNDFHPESHGEAEETSLPEPAIYRSALDDLYTLAKEITRKLVLGTLFQATSRLRAKDRDSPSPFVISTDVRIAAELVGLDKSWKTYWARLPRRAGLEVYSESDRFKRGRTGTKNGVKLTYGEVEFELGLSPQFGQSPPQGAIPPGIRDNNVANDENDVVDLESDGEASEVSSDGIVEVKLEREHRKRRRGLSPESFARAEEHYMRAVDRRSDREENARLRAMLGLEATEGGDEEDEDMPAQPKLKRSRRGERFDRRDATEDIAAWEVECVGKLHAEQDESESDGGLASPEEPEPSRMSSEVEAGARGGKSASLHSDDEMENSD